MWVTFPNSSHPEAAVGRSKPAVLNEMADNVPLPPTGGYELLRARDAGHSVRQVSTAYSLHACRDRPASTLLNQEHAMTENIEQSDIRVISDDELTRDEMDLVTGGRTNGENPFVQTVRVIANYVAAGGTLRDGAPHFGS
jgi:hypothetical protein